MRIQFGMTVLYARDLQRTVDFYRLLGLDIPDPVEGLPVAIHRTPSGLSIIFTTGPVATIYDPDWVRPERGYQQMMEFVVDDDTAVDEVWSRLTSAGFHGRREPAHINGPRAAIVDDPDGNAVLITSDRATLDAATA
jgi:catechol 2,3-dioxygenase-like lactoylglutathione lyase family enzyme